MFSSVCVVVCVIVCVFEKMDTACKIVSVVMTMCVRKCVFVIERERVYTIVNVVMTMCVYVYLCVC